MRRAKCAEYNCIAPIFVQQTLQMQIAHWVKHIDILSPIYAPSNLANVASRGPQYKSFPS